MPLRLVLCGFLALGAAQVRARTPGVLVDQIGQPRAGAAQVTQQLVGGAAGPRAVIAPERRGGGPTSQQDGVSPLAEACARAADGGGPVPPECATSLRQQADAAAQKPTPEGTLLYLFGQQASPTRTTSAVTRDSTDADSVARDLASEAAGIDAGSDAAAIAARQRPTPSPGPR